MLESLRVSLLPLVLVVGSAAAQAQQTSLPNSIVGASASIGDRDREAIAGFITHWSGVLASGDPISVNDARGEMISPARSPSATPIFLRAYSEAAVPALTTIASGNDPFRAINALQVARFLRSPEGVEVIIARVDPAGESNRAKRLVASGLLAEAITDAGMNPVQLDGTTRRLASLAAAEADWMIMLQEMEALDAVANLRDVAAASVELARQSQVRVLETAVARMKSDPQVVEAIYRTLLELRNQLVRMNSSQRAAFSKAFAPVFASIQSAAASGLATAPPNLKPTFEKTAEQAKVLANLTKG